MYRDLIGRDIRSIPSFINGKKVVKKPYGKKQLLNYTNNLVIRVSEKEDYIEIIYAEFLE